MPRSFALGGRFEAFIDSKVQEGRYNNASEVVRAALRLLEDREQERAARVAELRQQIEAGRLSGLMDETGEETLARLEARYRGLLASSAA